MLANGGALVALFTLVGGAGAIHFDMPLLKWAFGAFAVGLGLTLAAHMLAFLSQDRFLDASRLNAQRYRDAIVTGRIVPVDERVASTLMAGQRFYRFGLGVFVAAVIAFVAGCLLALLAVA